MADLFNILNRCSLLLERIEKGDYPSKKTLRTYLTDSGEERSDRTIDRAFEAMRDQFGLEIKYDQLQNGYYIDRAESLHPEALYRFLEQGKTLDLLRAYAENPRQTLKAVHFEERGNLKGLEYLRPAMEAIIHHKQIRLWHTAFGKPWPLPYKAKPYLLKEYQNRWYIVCVPENENELRFFGIDRISDLEVLTEEFAPDPDVNPQKAFDDRIGISLPEGEMEAVELSCDPFQGHYLKTLPLHESQEVIKDDEHELRIRIYVEPNFELRRKLLELTDCVMVIHPEWLAKEIQGCLENAVKRYEEIKGSNQ